MRARRAACLLLALLLTVLPASAAGTAGDSLVTESYAVSWADGLLAAAVSDIDAALANAGGLSGTTYVLSDGDRLSLGSGASAVLVSGSASVSAIGTLINATAGARAYGGGMDPAQLYIVAGSSSAAVTANGSARLTVWGSASVSERTAVFTDVPEGSWYYAYVYAAVDAGLIDGMTDTTFVPDGGFTVAQAIKIAACLHQYYHTGSVTLQNGEVWYSTYVDYAVANGVADASYASLGREDMDRAIDRRDFAVIFYNAMPAYEYTPVNTVDSIPDVAPGDEGSDEIYAMYRAGILDGIAADGSYQPESGIRRSEASAIVARMLDPGLRVSIAT